MLGGAAPITAPTAPQIAQSRIHDPCEANCILICWKLTGDWGACEIACQGTMCLVNRPQPETRLAVTLREEYASEPLQ